MNLSAVQHFAYDSFCYPLDNDTLEINLITGKDVEKVFIVSGDPFSGGIMGGNWEWNGEEKEVTEVKELQHNLRWTTRVSPRFKRLQYNFRLVSGSEEIIYNQEGFFTKEQYNSSGKFHGYFMYPWMNPADTFKVPEWVQNTVWYQIFPSRFCRGKSDWTCDKLLPWPDGIQEIEKSFGKGEPVYGGNIQGMIDKLDYLKDLGITGIYTTPLNLSSSQHKYNTDDYTKIDPEFGDAKLMKEYVEKAHQRGIKIMLDGVFNHSGWMFDKWQDVWQNKEKSVYKDWFMVNDYNFIEPGYGYDRGNSGKGKYYAFAFVDYMPKLNTNNPECRKYIIDICKKWVTEYDIDGLRLDVANELSHEFCTELYKAMTELKPDFYIVGEIWHDSQPWLRGKEFVSVMNYPLQFGIADFLCKDDWSVKQFEYAINRCYSMYYRQVNRVLFNQMDSHDTIRILNRCNGNKVRAREALVLLFAMTGSVCIYYGTEIMLPGGHDPDNRRCMPWKEIDEGKYSEDFEWTKKLIALRKNHPALRSTKYEFVYKDDDKEGKNRILHIVKEAEDGSEKLSIVCAAGSSTDCLEEYKSGKEVLFNSEGIVIYKH